MPPLDSPLAAPHTVVRRASSFGSDQLFALLVYAAAAVVAGLFAWILFDLVSHGLTKLSWAFLTEAPRSSGRQGGIASILVSTLLIVGVAMAVAMPMALAAAVWLSEYTRSSGWLAQSIRVALDVLAGVPSIVFGLFGNAFFCIYLGLGFSILSGGLTLACMVLPILIRATESGLSSVPDEWRRGAAALGLTKRAALWHVLLPAAAPAMGAGLLLGVGRAMAETAALVFTSGYVDRMPGSLMDSGRALAVHIFDLSMNVSGGDKAAYGSALVLIGLLVVINGVSLKLSERFLAKRISL
jgi:phosphate transport system permease protein